MDKNIDISSVENLRIQSYSEHPEVKHAADVLVAEYYKDNSRKKDKKAYTRSARKLVASLWLHPDTLFRFTTNKNYYGPAQRKQVWMTPKTQKLFNTARTIGWIELKFKGLASHLSKSGSGYNSVYTKTEDFYQLLTNLKEEDIGPDEDAPRVILRCLEGILKKLPDAYVSSSVYQDAVDALENHYDIIKKTSITLPADNKQVPLSDLYYVRRFKGDTTRGGRIYAPFSTYPKSKRLALKMNGVSVASLDISQLHPQLILRFLHKRDNEDQGMLAKAMGLEDVYSMPDYPDIPRGVHKKLINTLFNSKTKEKGAAALRNTYYWYSDAHTLVVKTYSGRTKRKGNAVFEQKQEPGKAALDYIESFKTHHPLMAPALYSDIGTLLQRVDGRLMISIMRMHTQVEIPVLTVHDELIVPKTQATMDFAEIALRDAFKQVCEEEGSFGSIYAKWSFGDGTKEKQVEIRLGD
tara:strand:- start:765 stop:2162 length:1398 start_codon:yes stop_codon:yes gene_type:complete